MALSSIPPSGALQRGRYTPNSGQANQCNRGSQALPNVRARAQPGCQPGRECASHTGPTGHVCLQTTVGCFSLRVAQSLQGLGDAGGCAALPRLLGCQPVSGQPPEAWVRRGRVDSQHGAKHAVAHTNTHTHQPKPQHSSHTATSARSLHSHTLSAGLSTHPPGQPICPPSTHPPIRRPHDSMNHPPIRPPPPSHSLHPARLSPAIPPTHRSSFAVLSATISAQHRPSGRRRAGSQL